MRRLLTAACVLALLAGPACTDSDDTESTDGANRGPAAGGTATTTASGGEGKIESFPVPDGSGPHDVAPAADGGVWYTAQRTGELGHLDPATGRTYHVKLGANSSPHGVILGPDGAPWVTDTGQNAIVRVDPATRSVEVHRIDSPEVGMHTAAFAPDGMLWFTGQRGYFGRLRPTGGAQPEVFPAPGGAGPYGITVAPNGTVYFASLARSYVAQVDPATGAATVLMLPTPDQGARRVWSDSKGRIWTSEWNEGQVAVLDPTTNQWREWKLPGDHPQAYAVYVDEHDNVWLSDFGANALVRFDPETEKFQSYPLPSNPSNVRQILGRPGEVWGAESAADKLVVIRGA